MEKQDTLVQLETAKLANSKGFDWNCYRTINEEKEIELAYDVFGELYFTISDIKQAEFNGYTCYLAPTQSLLQKWLREEHNINFFVFLSGDKGWIYSTSYHLSDFSIKIFNSYEEALEEALIKSLNRIIT